MKDTLKKIWGWVAGILTAIAGIFVLFKVLNDPDKKDFKDDKKEIEKEIEFLKNKEDKTAADKKATKAKIKELEKKIKVDESKIRDTKNAKDTLKDFKEKYKK